MNKPFQKTGFRSHVADAGVCRACKAIKSLLRASWDTVKP